jgi:hypothetical protein
VVTVGCAVDLSHEALLDAKYSECDSLIVFAPHQRRSKAYERQSDVNVTFEIIYKRRVDLIL